MAIKTYDGARMKRDNFNLLSTITVIPAAKKESTITSSKGEK